MKKKNFTLVELLCATALVVILAGIGFSAYSYASYRGKEAATKSLIARVGAGLETLKTICRQPLALIGAEGKYDVIVSVTGGGVTGQAGAIRHGVARALLEADETLRPVLKKAGFLTRDPRMKERKKYGLKAARRASQFSKR